MATNSQLFGFLWVSISGVLVSITKSAVVLTSFPGHVPHGSLKLLQDVESRISAHADGKVREDRACFPVAASCCAVLTGNSETRLPVLKLTS